MRRRRTTRAEEAALAARIARGDAAARDELVERNLPIALWFARRYGHLPIPFDDLAAGARLGLVLAASRFDASRGVAFGTFAFHWMRTEVQRVVRGERLVSIPPNNFKAHAPVTPERVVSIAPTDAWPAGEPPPSRLAVAAEQETALERREIVEVIRRVLDPRLVLVIVLRFGLDGGGSRKLREIGDALGLSRERARQMEREALARLRGSFLARGVA